MRAVLREALRRTGLLPIARAGRAWARRLRYLPHNLRYWRSAAAGAAGDGTGSTPLQVPPLALIDLVSGQPDIPWFLEGGKRAAAAIRAALARQGVAIEELAALLDFGCGCGRVLRHWQGLAPGTEIHGSDLSPRSIEWGQRHLGFARLQTNGLAPPLPYPDQSFDLVYALSVFTHLPEDLQQPWIDELRRVLKPGGLLLLSTHGERYAAELDPRERARFRAGELVVRASEDAGRNACGAYHPPAYVRDVLVAGMEVLEHVPEGAAGNPHQDQWLLRVSAPRSGRS
jgi:SAM-dependent methyltransferase